MDSAHDRITRKLISAVSREATRVNCICPECASPVFFAGGSGTGQIAHFRHRPNAKARETCDLYHAGMGADVRRFVGQRPNRLRELRLCFELRPAAGSGKWQLALQIPRFENCSSFHLDNYSPNAGHYEVDEVPLEGRSFAVFPQKDDYEVEVISDDGSRSVTLVEGLGSFALFALGHTISRRVLEGEDLEWGRAYAVVQRLIFDLKAVPAEVQRRKLAEDDGWYACIFGLPAESDHETRDWARRFLRRTIAVPTGALTVLSPISARLDRNETWFIPPGHTSVVVAFRFPDTPHSPVDLSMVLDHEPKKNYRITNPGQEIVLEVEKLPAGLSELRLAVPEPLQITFDVREDTGSVPRQKIAIAFISRDVVTALPLWDSSMLTLFMQVRAGALKLYDVRLPDVGGITIAGIKAGTRFEHTFKFGPDEATPLTVGAEVTTLLEGLLTHLNTSFEIEAGGFGRICFPPPSIKTPNGYVPIAPLISKRTRDRSEWLTLAIGERTLKGRSRFFPQSDPRCRFTAHVRQYSR